ncbi:MaoC-like dehydratase [gamma proteobacterium HdN1]|nr:MaoC-like dehydratase [gamma proteobacterium HdN1]
MKTVEPAQLASFIGQSMGASEWFAIDQARINAFADTTLDHQYIHVDPEKSKATPFGGTIAHGFLSLSLLPFFQESMAGWVMPTGLKMGMNYGFDKIRFLAPVKVNSRVRGAAKLKDAVEKNPGQWLLTFEFSVEIEGEPKPALISDWLVMYFV